MDYRGEGARLERINDSVNMEFIRYIKQKRVL